MNIELIFILTLTLVYLLFAEAEHAKNLVKLAQTMRPILKEEVCIFYL